MKNANTRQLRLGFGGGAVLLLIASWMEWRGWASGGSRLAVIDVLAGGILLCVWIGWEIYSRSKSSARP